MSRILYLGMGPPYVVRAHVASSAEFDPSTVTSVVLELQKPKSKTVVDWTTSIVTQTSDAIEVEHPLASDDLNEEGFWAVYALCTLPGGVRRTEVGGFHVDSPFRRR